MPNQPSNHLKYLLATKQIDFANDSFIIILMDDSFIFDKDAHEEYADVVAHELATGFGYTQFSKVLAGVTVTEDDVNDRCETTWSSPSWTAAGGDIGPSVGAIIIDDTVANDPVVGFIDFGGAYTQASGGTAAIANVGVRIP